jgi:starch-binding outer membrane protein SusE/F
MKAILKNFLFMAAVSATLVSCDKDEVQAVLKPGADNQLTVNNATLVLLQANAANPATAFTWGKADFGYDAAITYTIQLCKGGTNFASSATTTEVAMGTALAKSFTVGEFNAKMQEIISDGTATAVQARIKASVGSNVDPVYSNVVSMTVTSYLDIVNYGFPDALNVAGNYQGWSPGSAPQIVRTRNGGFNGYEGYIIFNNGAPEFKVVKGNDWPAGDFGNAGGGNLQNGGPNLTLPSGGAGITGLYRLRANTTSLTWSFDKINTWGIIGNATPGGWGASTAMALNATNGTWSITTDLVAGEMKFRANNDWGINLGDNAPVDNRPEYDGSNIAVTIPGNYTITLNIGIGGNYTYKLRKN